KSESSGEQLRFLCRPVALPSAPPPSGSAALLSSLHPFILHAINIIPADP
ncbi:uncharacterized, partial [Tachysurus ichikawai]